MPSTNQYDERRPVYVKPFSSSTVLYGFKTNVRASIGTLAGHTAVPAAPPQNLVFGASAPQPGRVTVKPEDGADQYDSTFYDFSKFAALKTARHTLTRPKIRRGRSSTRSRSVYVTIGADPDGNGGIKYAWNMSATLYARIGAARAELKILDATPDIKDLAWGVNEPKPPRASKNLVGTTFYDPSATLPAGWSSQGSTGAESISPGA
jgi:hypothetical protein